MRAVDDQVRAAVQSAIAFATSDVEVRAALERAWRRLAQPAGGDQARRIAALEKQIQAAKRRLADAATLLVDGALDREGYEALRDQQREALQAAEIELTRIRGITILPSLPPLQSVLEQVGGWSEAMRTADTPAQRDVLAVLLDRVSARRLGYGRYEVSIEWTALGKALSSLDVALAA